MNLSQLFQTVTDIAKTDANKLILPALAGFFTSISTNPSALNVTAALAKLNVDVMAALPTIGQDELKGIATLLNNQLAALATPKAA
ncbi:hypothetical protein KGP36_06765 [Patescibacteria group bacterium]|nr:hypothetical protein [Patescibacteria group bacterium]